MVQTTNHIFTWELLMQYSARVTSNQKVTFYGFWCAATSQACLLGACRLFSNFCQLPTWLIPGVRRGCLHVLACWARRWDLLRTYGLANVPTALLLGLATGHARDIFQEGWYNLITLQNLDYSKGSSCCSGKYAISDGLMLSFKLKQAYLECPWQPAEDAAVVEGTRFRDRLLIPAPALRKDLQSFCGRAPPPHKRAAGSGLEPRELRALTGRLREAGLQCLLFMLKDPKVDSSGRSYANAQVCLSPYRVLSPRRQG